MEANLTLTSSDNLMDMAYDSGRSITVEIEEYVRNANRVGLKHGVRILSTDSEEDIETTGVLTGKVEFNSLSGIKGWIAELDLELSDGDILDILEEAGL